ncbi:hypothetical protein BOTBODRAFT_642434 [Botryobasidium botryosum FD-172 SS1]|uniref:4-nitrophenylphosphatase n=1 Tax=Botryobasidium botryosum (strain FD-172 SS1) TaxID=930990 RepID=A0A067M178_BOTB1|nr:hypothetical protein BOTBODRAFT_642434 [Botryobasidium botryosum FD-172 SS1]
MSTRLTTSEGYAELIAKYDTFMFDCDGVLWRGTDVIDGIIDVLNYLRSHNKSILFVTNNASSSRRYYKSKFDKLGIQASVDEIFGSAYASAVYISSVLKIPKDQKVYVIGMEGLEQELAEEGIQYEGGTDPADNTLAPFSLTTFTHPTPPIAAVLCGLDVAINYTKISKALQYLLHNPDCHFLATNEDSTYPASGGILPGAGAISATLRYALKRDPVSIGKPNSTMLDCIRAKHDFDPARTIMIGDRLDTDILFGKSGGVSTLLVMTGVTKESDITGPNASPVVPGYIVQSLGDLAVLANPA